METSFGKKEKQMASRTMTNSKEEYRESIKKLIDTAVKDALDEEMHKATQELLEEQRATLRQIVDEEKKAIWERAEELKESVLKLGL